MNKILSSILAWIIISTSIFAADVTPPIEHWGFDNPYSIPAYARQHIRNKMARTSIIELKHVKSDTPRVLVIHWQSNMIHPILPPGISMPSNCVGEVDAWSLIAACTYIGPENRTMLLNRWFYKYALRTDWRAVLDYEITIALGK